MIGNHEDVMTMTCSRQDQQRKGCVLHRAGTGGGNMTLADSLQLRTYGKARKHFTQQHLRDVAAKFGYTLDRLESSQKYAKNKNMDHQTLLNLTKAWTPVNRHCLGVGLMAFTFLDLSLQEDTLVSCSSLWILARIEDSPASPRVSSRNSRSEVGCSSAEIRLKYR